MAKQKRMDLLPFVADTSTKATNAETAYDDSCIVSAHRANTRSGFSGLSLAERKQVEKGLRKLAEKLGRKKSS
jgi:hypothetical protein